MKVLLYGINYHPELTGIGKYSGELCDWLSTQGHEVRVVTAPPYYPSWKVDLGYSSFFYRIESLNGVRIYRCPLWVPKNQCGRNRILHLLSFMFSSAPLAIMLAILWRPNILIAIEPPLLCSLPALIAARLGKSTAWLHVQDLEIDAAIRVGLIKDSFWVNWIFSAEKWLLTKYNRISSISKQMINSLVAKGVSKSKLILFPNWVDTTTTFPTYEQNNLRLELNIDNNVVIALYSGNMGKKQGLDIILEAAHLLRDSSNLLFVICGDGTERARLESLAVGMDNVIMLPLQPLNRLNELLNMADIHLLPQQVGMDEVVMPSKLLGMLASAKPVVCCTNNNTELAELIVKCGVVVQPGNIGQFVNALLSLLADPAKRSQLGQQGRAYCEAKYEKERVLSSFFKNLIATQGTSR